MFVSFRRGSRCSGMRIYCMIYCYLFLFAEDREVPGCESTVQWEYAREQHVSAACHTLVESSMCQPHVTDPRLGIRRTNKTGRKPMCYNYCESVTVSSHLLAFTVLYCGYLATCPCNEKSCVRQLCKVILCIFAITLNAFCGQTQKTDSGLVA